MKVSIDEESNREIQELHELEQQIKEYKQKDLEKEININSQEKTINHQKIEVSPSMGEKPDSQQKSENLIKNNYRSKQIKSYETSDSISKLALDFLYPKIRDIFSRNLKSDIDCIELDLDLDRIRNIFKDDLDENRLLLYNLFSNSKGNDESFEGATKEERKLIALEIIFAADLIHRLLKK